MKIPFFVVDAFAPRPFTGSPAVVCVAEAPLPRATGVALAQEIGGRETAVVSRRGEGYEIRWYAPEGELPLCAHATLAAGHVVMTRLEPSRQMVPFHGPAGALQVMRRDGRLVLDFPALQPTPAALPAALAAALPRAPSETLRAGKYVLVYEDEHHVAALSPRLARMAEVEAPGVIVTAPAAAGAGFDFVVRAFAVGDRGGAAREEPVSGSAFTRLVPFRAARLGKARLSARALSLRGAEVDCELAGQRVEIAGQAFITAEGSIAAPIAPPERHDRP